MIAKFVKCILVLSFIFLSSSCGTEIGKNFDNMFAIRTVVLELSKAENVGIKIHNSSLLSISVVNSYLNDKTGEERKKAAKKFATKAFELYESRDSLKSIFISFPKYERKYFIVEINNSIKNFEFTPSELI